MINLKSIVDIINPKYCYSCSNEVQEDGLCNSCWKEITFIHNPSCIRCSNPFPHEISEFALCASCINKEFNLDKIKSAMKYDSFSKKIIMLYKNHNATYMAKFFAKILVSCGKPLLDRTDIIVTVPIHFWKMVWRGYNQTSLIAKHVSDISNKTFLKTGILKTKFTQSQSNYNQLQRQKNIKDTFEVNGIHKQEIKGKNILIIDDMITTGATMEECARILKLSGAKKIFGLTIAKSVHKSM
ncbi:ComF family protein [Candidatus Nesciobacter abundans]|uniref:ComF family protein n=1 Tax=Candidatus Nesciobacter abundans TaxID=2601668 RepID=A0A5C0UFU7_9PROT|nr:ComF family protein [Candidatus Nesciobacter abundans]QEK38928.1 ComF family protein [Candidatus Nesciobacter abundans]